MADDKKVALPLMCGSFESGQSDRYIESLPDEETRALALCERHYYRGEGKACYASAVRLFQSENGLIRISAILMMGFGALCMGDSQKAAVVISAMDSASFSKPEGGGSYTAEEKRLIALLNNLSVILLHLKGIPTLPLPIYDLPTGMRLIAFYAMAHKEYLSGNYGEAAGLARAALTLKDGSYPIGEIYLNLVLAMCYIGERKSGKASEHFLIAWEIARPEKFYQPFAEHHGLLGGLVEIHLKNGETEVYEKIIKQVYRFSQAWRDIHNPGNKELIANVLTTTEFTVAMLANKEWSNEQIAEHLNVFINTVKSMLKKTYKKLGITSRKELKRYMLK